MTEPNPQQDVLDACIESLDALIALEVQKLEALREHRLGLVQLRKRLADTGDQPRD